MEQELEANGQRNAATFQGQGFEAWNIHCRYAK